MFLRCNKTPWQQWGLGVFFICVKCPLTFYRTPLLDFEYSSMKTLKLCIFYFNAMVHKYLSLRSKPPNFWFCASLALCYIDLFENNHTTTLFNVHQFFVCFWFSMSFCKGFFKKMNWQLKFCVRTLCHNVCFLV